MRTKSTFIASILLTAIVLASCGKEPSKTFDENEKVSISLTGSIVTETKTHIENGANNPQWSEDDAIGIHIVGSDVIEATNVKLDGVLDGEGAEYGNSAIFEGEVGGFGTGDYTIYGYYPYNALGDATSHHTEAKIEIPTVQRPTKNSFDPNADIMTMLPVEFTHDGSPVSHDGLQFKRVLATIRILFDEISDLEGEPLTRITFTTDAGFWMAGKGNFDLTTGTFDGFYEDATTMITIEPTEDIIANGEDGILICVPVMEFVSGTILTFTGETENFTFTKSVVVPNAGIELKASSIHTLKIPAPEEVVPKIVYDETFDVSSESDWNSMRDAIINGGNNKNYLINVTADFELVGILQPTFDYLKNIYVLIQGDHTISLNSSTSGQLLFINTNQTVTLCTSLKGHSDNGESLVFIYSGTLIMKDGGKISDNTASIGGGVKVTWGTLIMNGGEISSNTTYGVGGGVDIAGGNLIMNGGKICNNSASDSGDGGGVCVRTDANFTMTGGEISGNTARTGGGVYIYDANFTKSGNSIIYGSDAGTDSNNATYHFGNAGDAVFFSDDSKYRQTTAGAGVDMSVKDGVAIGFDN